MPIKSLPFFVGGHYRDRTKGYTVIAMDENRIDIEYDDGLRETLTRNRAEIKARIYQNIIAEYRRNHPVLSLSYFRTLGFLSSNGKFEAELPHRSVPAFLRNYEILSGDSVSPQSPGIALLGDVDKWGPELRIYFPAISEKLDFGPGVEVRAGQTPDILRVNNNALWLRLIGIGFRLGRNHDVRKIRASVPPEMIGSFEQGRALEG